jgi:2-oxoglutarate dehydrogenase E2 component (dihydrolipoamide succinyltransferase)
MVKVTLPELGEEITGAVVSFWHRRTGDKINKGEDLVEMATDKATFNVPAPAAGTITETYFEEGDTAKVGDTLAAIDEK